MNVPARLAILFLSSSLIVNLPLTAMAHQSRWQPYRGYRDRCEQRHDHHDRHGKWQHRGKSHWRRGGGHRGGHHRDTRVVVTARGWDREFLGIVLGGATGGILASEVARGNGRGVAIVGGSVLGAIVGGSIGRSMDRADRRHFGRVLESTPCDQKVAWRNPDTRVAYEVTPLADHTDAVGRYCREYQTTALIGGERRQVYGTACRQPDGSWESVR